MFPQLHRENPADLVYARANDQFKQRWRQVFWGSVALALLVHILVFWLTPPLNVVAHRSETEVLPLEPPLDSRPAPERPPVAFRRGLGPIREAGREEITPPLPPTPDRPLPPPPITFQDLAGAPTFTPYDVAPVLKNREEAVTALSRFYPESRRESGHTRLQLWFLLDRFGAVRRTVVKESSGLADVDRAALQAAELMEFTPAWSGDRTVPVWIALPIAFQLEAVAPLASDTVASQS